MADVKISDLTPAGAATGNMQIEVNDAGTSKRVTMEQVQAKVITDAAVTGKLDKAGGTMTGAITLHADPSSNLHAATKQYADTKLPLAGGTMTGALTLSGAPSINLHAATKQYVDGIIAAQDAMVFVGAIDCSGNPNYPAADRGWTYRVSVAGRIGGGSGPVVEVGDMLICTADSTSAGNHATVGANWTIVQTNIDGAVIGPASVTSGNPAVFSGATGKLIAQVTFASFKSSLALVKGDVGLGNVINVPQRGFIHGLTLSNNISDATNDIDIAAGVAVDMAGAVGMVLASTLTKRLDAAWAAGGGNGGLDTGSIANTTYHVWLIMRSDTGVVDALFSTSASAPTMPANYDYRRRIGSIMRASGAIRGFTQRGDDFRLHAAVADVTATNPGTSAVTRTLSVPTGIEVDADVSVHMVAGSHDHTIGSVIISPLTSSDAAAGEHNLSASLNIGTSGVVNQSGGARARCRTNTSGQVRSRCQISNTTSTLRIATYGWSDTRGRDE